MAYTRPSTDETTPRQASGAAGAPRASSRLLLATACLGTMLLLLIALSGCAPADRQTTTLDQAIALAARPILGMDADAVWTDCYDRLLKLAPASLVYLAEHPALRHPAAPDDLRVMLHTSLLRLLAHPAARPRLTATCLETTLDVLHFDIKVDGRRIGTVWLAADTRPTAWHDLYPADFNHELAARVDAEADRLAMRKWWLEYRDRLHNLPIAPPLKPQPPNLWPLLSRRYADRWTFRPKTRIIRCGGPDTDPALIYEVTRDYNLVRAVCVWLGASGQPGIRDRLIELVASPSPTVAHNALFALHYAPDPRIRDLLERYKSTTDPAEPADRNVQPAVTRLGAGEQRSDS